MARTTDIRHSSNRVFRLSYASRAKKAPAQDEAIQLATAAARNNHRDGVSGVLFSQHGLFLQWLEGPASKVCELMYRIAADDRHHDVRLLSAGWGSERRFPDWSMQLADIPLPSEIPAWASARTAAPYGETSLALRAFENASTQYHQHSNATTSVKKWTRELVLSGLSDSLALPYAARQCPHACAQFMDDVCTELRAGWVDDCWNSVQVAIAMANLNLLWKKNVTVLDPETPRQSVAVVVPPGSTEFLGAVIKADLLRTSGIRARTIRAESDDATVELLAQKNVDAIVVAGSRIGWRDEQRRVEKFASRIRQRFRDIPTFVGGQDSGTLNGWPERIAYLRDDATDVRMDDIDWLTLSQLVNDPRKNSN
ncbi:MAG: BLUF domain-containing protein [Pseudomonadota bacterium]